MLVETNNFFALHKTSDLVWQWRVIKGEHERNLYHIGFTYYSNYKSFHEVRVFRMLSWVNTYRRVIVY